VYDRGGSRQNEIEAQRVIDLIEDHAENNSDKSLGVIAFSSAQEQAIRDALIERREENAVLDAFVSQDDVLDEFFIKNLEMVQGDERDRMIFSVGYGPAEDGTISTNFGPLNKSGGERRLNVAVTRAKEKITVVCSMQPGDIDLSGSNSTGAQDFKNYLEYAQKERRHSNATIRLRPHSISIRSLRRRCMRHSKRKDMMLSHRSRVRATVSTWRSNIQSSQANSSSGLSATGQPTTLEDGER